MVCKNPECGKDFEPSKKNQKYCCPKCRQRGQNIKYQQKIRGMIYKKKCGRCGKTFEAKTQEAQYCPVCSHKRLWTESGKRITVEKHVKKKKNIETINHLARANGMTYGQYVAYMCAPRVNRHQ